MLCPGFACDCIETLEEINMEARSAFLQAGGKVFHYIPCLNDSPEGMAAMADLCEQHLAGWPTWQASDPASLKASRARALALGAQD